MPRREPKEQPVPRRRWRDKFRNALRGLRVGAQGHSSFFVHFFFTALVIAAALAMSMSILEWAILIGCVSLVLTAELFNSALESLARSPNTPQSRAVRNALDIAAGAVLVAAVGAAIIGSLLFVHKLGIMLDWWV
jgi:diacylglycerol kinase